MSMEDQAVTTETHQEMAQPSAETQNTETAAPEQKEHMIPKSRFDEVNTKFKDLQAQYDKLLAEKQEADGYKSLHQQAEERAKALEGVIAQMLEARLETIPEELHDLIPEGLTPEQKLAWIDRAERKGVFGAKVHKPVGGPTNPPDQSPVDLNGLSATQLLRIGYSKQ
ncbi:hypothetical protein [Brevibacillus thermoruber]|jgi:hypothetical protein|uniref:hypothetical protein n=1 Tax=Brevibacillus thermoruber TaxID=33942 RepID=UPI000687EB91|nr:hypothetical protein [Brevibacillus thermoruber]